jgi:DNA invertase Pin-like site-specific DNA recombinase
LGRQSEVRCQASGGVARHPRVESTAVKRAWLLARVSTTKRAQDESPDRQLTQLRAYCERQGATIVGEGAERRSGGTLDRPELNRAMAAARTGKIDVLAVVDLDRLGRNLKAMLECTDELRRLGVSLVVLRLGDEGVVDTGTATGRLLFQVLAAVAEFIRNLYREKAIDGQAHARARGKHVGRPRELLARDAFEIAARLLREGFSYRHLSAELARRGYLQPGRLLKGGRNAGEYRKPRPWPAGTLCRLLAVQKPVGQSDTEPRADGGSGGLA